MANFNEILEMQAKAFGLTLSDIPRFGEDSLNVKNYTVRLEQDTTPSCPREDFDNLGTMACGHSRYRLGDKQVDDVETFFIGLVDDQEPGFEDSLNGFENWFWERNVYSAETEREFESRKEKRISQGLDKYYILLPLYLYEHSGITMSTGPFSCPWDSGQVGWIYVSKECVRKEYGWKKITKSREKQICRYLEGEVETYDQYLTGEVYGYIIEDEYGEELDSCWGYYGDHHNSGIYDASLSIIDVLIKERNAKRWPRIKTWIKNRVPLLQRQTLVNSLPVAVS